MKKIFYAVLFSLVCIGFTSCGGYSERAGEKMLDRFDNGEMTKEDYSECIDVLEKYVDYIDEEMGKLIADSNNERKFVKGLEDLEDKIDDKWEGVEDLTEILGQSSEKEMGASNAKRLDKLGDKIEKKFGDTYKNKIEKKFEGVPQEYYDLLLN